MNLFLVLTNVLVSSLHIVLNDFDYFVFNCKVAGLLKERFASWGKPLHPIPASLARRSAFPHFRLLLVPRSCLCNIPLHQHAVYSRTRRYLSHARGYSCVHGIHLYHVSKRLHVHFLIIPLWVFNIISTLLQWHYHRVDWGGYVHPSYTSDRVFNSLNPLKY